MGWPCDLEKAYKQVPGDPALRQWATIVVWDPYNGKPAFFIPLCQLFGGKSPPLNFARYAAWLCEVAGPLFGLPLTHCVDDVIGVEPEEVAESGNLAFKVLCMATGWAVSPKKSPLPTSHFLVIGVELDLENSGRGRDPKSVGKEDSATGKDFGGHRAQRKTWTRKRRIVDGQAGVFTVRVQWEIRPRQAQAHYATGRRVAHRHEPATDSVNKVLGHFLPQLRPAKRTNVPGKLGYRGVVQRR